MAVLIAPMPKLGRPAVRTPRRQDPARVAGSDALARLALQWIEARPMPTRDLAALALKPDAATPPSGRLA